MKLMVSILSFYILIAGASPVMANQLADTADSRLELASQTVISTNKNVIQTAPHQDIETREDKERKYRSCLFSFLPRMGSDVAAGLIRDACKSEYMH